MPAIFKLSVLIFLLVAAPGLCYALEDIEHVTKERAQSTRPGNQG